MKNKTLFVVVTIIMCLSVSINLFASDINTSQTSIAVIGSVDLTQNGGGGGNGDNGSLVVTVPTALYFTITPNQDTLVTSIEDKIINESDVEVNISFMGFETNQGNDCKVIANNTYTDDEWLELGQADTESKIGLGLTYSNGTLWSSVDTSEVIDSFNIPSKSEEPVEVAVKCGKAWSTDKVLDYTLQLVISRV